MAESPNRTGITPGKGSITDAANNTYTLPTSLSATENGQPMAGGKGTGTMEYYNHTVYAQDNNTKAWYTWSNATHFWSGVAAPPAPLPTPTPTPTHHHTHTHSDAHTRNPRPISNAIRFEQRLQSAVWFWIEMDLQFPARQLPGRHQHVRQL